MLALLNGAYQIDIRYLSGSFDRRYTYLVTTASAILAQIALPLEVWQRNAFTLGSERSAIVVRHGCNGIEALLLMMAGILALPATWRTRLRALATYLPVLFVLNLFRVVALLYVFTVHPEYINVAHYQVGQAMMVVFVMAFWMDYVGRITDKMAPAG